MNEQPREPLEQRRPINVLRWIVRTIVVATCVLLLTVAVFLTSRYRANQRLMKVVEQYDHGVDVEWKGPNIGWLNRAIGEERAMAILGHPVVLSVGGRGRKVPDHVVQQLLGELTGLERIELGGRRIASGCLEAIATRQRVKNLSFHLSGIGPEDARWLSRMPHLEQVSFTQQAGKPGENDWSWLKALPGLKRLYVTLYVRGVVTDRDIIALAQCPALRHLAVTGETFSDEALVRLCDVPALERLSISGTNFRLHFPPGRKLPATLLDLTLSSKELDDASLVHLCDLPALQRLDIHGTNVRLHFPAGRKLPATLRTLSVHSDLHGTQLDDDSLAAIAELPALQELSFFHFPITDDGMAVVAKLPSLEKLYVRWPEGFTDAGVAHLVRSRSLSQIEFVQEWCLTSRALLDLLNIPNWTDIRFKDVRFHREPGTAAPHVTPDTVDEFLSTHSEMQADQQRADHTSFRYDPGK